MRSTAPTDKGDQTRRHIVTVAAEAFAERGYAGTSLNDVIRATGLTKGGFYFHFPSKEALALEVMHVKQQEWAGKVVTAAAVHPRAIDQLVAMASALVDLHDTDPTFGSVHALSRELCTDADLEPQTSQHLTAWTMLVADVIRRAQIEGDAKPDVDPDALADMAVCAFIGIEEISDMHASTGLTMRARVDQFTGVLLAAIRPS
ncbi:MAG TPA: TetR/AcrR family transcriptional regulator [Mycobacteriales bacterium]|jgi:AcrR family transcriptional regulator|nr:TetR/AcrR family transcriptional regulator [Mycobacteriales bacterium]